MALFGQGGDMDDNLRRMFEVFGGGDSHDEDDCDCDGCSGCGHGNDDGVPATAEALKAAYDEFTKKYTFTPGMLVRWKKGMANKNTPKASDLGIVIKVLPEPIHSNEEESGSPYFMEPLDIVIGFYTKTRDGSTKFICFYYDSSRFEPAE